MPAFIIQNATHILFNNDLAVFRIAKANAQGDSLTINGSGNLLADPVPFAAYHNGSEWKRANSVSYTPTNSFEGKLSFGFSSGVQMTLRSQAFPTHFLFELTDIGGSPANVQRIMVAQLRINGEENSEFAGIIYKGPFVISQLTLAIETNVICSADSLHAISFTHFPEVVGESGRPPHLKLALLGCPKDQWLSVVENVEQAHHLPHPTINGMWAKRHPDVKSSYLFVDITEQNAAAVINYALKGKFKYIVPYVSTWAQSTGHYQPHNDNYPSGLAGLLSVVGQVHARGLKFGFHTLSCLISPDDAYVQPVPDTRLAKESPVALAAAVGPTNVLIRVSTSLDDYKYYLGKGETDIIIGNEIMKIERIEPNGFRVKRGHQNTTAQSHPKDATIHHLPAYEGKYFPDLRTNLLAEIADNFAAIYNHLGIKGDFAFLDGSETLDRVLPRESPRELPEAPWFASQLIVETFYRRLSGNVLLEASGSGANNSNYNWHPLSRGVSGDYAAIGVEAYMDYRKIDYYGERFTKAFLPQELGWMGLLAKTGDSYVEASFASTTLDEIEYQMNRALGHSAPIGLETHYEELLANGFTDTILDLIAKYEELRLSNYFPASMLQQLKQPDADFLDHYRLKKGGHRLVQNASHVYGFQRQAYAEHVVLNPTGETWEFENPFADQVLKVKITALPGFDGYEGEGPELANALLTGFEVSESDPNVTCTLANGRITATFTPPSDPGAPTTGWCSLTKRLPAKLNLSNRKAIGLLVTGDGKDEVVSIELEDNQEMNRQYQFKIDFDSIGGGVPRPVLLPVPATTELFKYPYHKQGIPPDIKRSLRRFNYEDVRKLTIHIKNILPGTVEFSLGTIKALRQKYPALRSPRCVVNETRFVFPVTLRPRDTDNSDLEPWEYLFFDSLWHRKYDGNHKELTKKAVTEAPIVRHGINTITYSHEGNNKALVTILMEDAPGFPS